MTLTTPLYTLFDTAIGSCGIGWSDAGIVRLQLPEVTPAATRKRMGSLAESRTPPPWVKKAIGQIARHLDGDIQDLSKIRLDLSAAPPFHAKVYAIACAIPASATLTYGEIATRAGSPGASRAVGRAMATNPIAILVPCHRVLAAGGRPGGFSAHGGTATKAKILAVEGVALGAAKVAKIAKVASGSLFDGIARLQQVRDSRGNDRAGDWLPESSGEAGGRPSRRSEKTGDAPRPRNLAAQIPLGSPDTQVHARSSLPPPLARTRPHAAELSFDADEAVRVLSANDPKLGRLMEAVGPFALKLLEDSRGGGAFAALAQSIVYQQLTGKAAATILGRVKSLLVTRARGKAEGVFFTPRELLVSTVADLRVAGLSGNKVLALQDLATKAESGQLPTLAELEKMNNEAIIERLTTIRGIGRWTVEMMLMFRLGRPDVLPLGDYGIRKGFALTFKTKELPTPTQLAKRGERWRPYRTVASWYLWRALEQSS